MNRKLISAGLAALLLVPLAAVSQDKAPAATPAADAAAAGTGTVVFFRERSSSGWRIRYKVRENGVELCKLGKRLVLQRAGAGGQTCLRGALGGQGRAESGSRIRRDLLRAGGSLRWACMAGHPNLAPSTKETFEGMKAKLKDNTGKDLDPPEAKDDKK